MFLVDLGENCHKVTVSGESVPNFKIKGDLAADDFSLREQCCKSLNDYWLYDDKMNIQKKLKKRCSSRHQNQYGDNMFEASTETLLVASQTHSFQSLEQAMGINLGNIRGGSDKIYIDCLSEIIIG